MVEVSDSWHGDGREVNGSGEVCQMKAFWENVVGRRRVRKAKPEKRDKQAVARATAKTNKGKGKGNESTLQGNGYQSIEQHGEREASQSIFFVSKSVYFASLMDLCYRA